jgi:hypothetical protein
MKVELMMCLLLCVLVCAAGTASPTSLAAKDSSKA